MLKSNSFIGSAPTGRSKYILDPSVQSSSAYGQTSNLYAPNQSQTIGAPQPSYGNAPTNNLQSYNNQFNPQPFNAAPIAQPAIMNPTPTNAFAPAGLPPIEIAQQAMPPASFAPGWNDPPALTSKRPVRNWKIFD